MYRGVVKDLDEMKKQKIIAENKLAESLKREEEQTNMIEKLEQRNQALRGTLDKTMNKMNQLTDGTPNRTADSAGHKGRGASSADDAAEMDRMTLEIKQMKVDKQKDARTLEEVKNKLFKITKDLEAEKERSTKLETFIRTVALKP
jgi:hypothetical protein